MSGPGIDLPPSDPRFPALRQVRPPAFLLLCVGALQVLFAFVWLALVLLKVPSPFTPPGQAPVVLEMNALALLGMMAGVVCGVLSLWGALSAMQLKGYGLATVGAITALFPMSPTCPLGIPTTLWMLYTLNRPHVRKAFAP